jgi:hypothetical protein
MNTIKMGSNGYEVIRLQELLDITADGIFDNDVHDAVVAFQKKRNLVPDGIVGPMTWAVLEAGVDTDLRKSDNIEYYPMSTGRYIKNSKGENVWMPNYFAGPYKKDWLFGHHTGGWENPYQTIDIWDKDVKTVGVEYVIGGKHVLKGDTGYDGRLLRCMPKNAYSYHLTIGDNIVHKNSIGIEVCSFGGLTKGGYKKADGTYAAMKPNGYYTYTGVEVSFDQVYDIGWNYRGFQYFHKLSVNQLNTLESVMKLEAEVNGINLRGGLYQLIKDKGVKHAFEMCNYDYVSKNPGFYVHGNVYAHKNDLFPQQEFIDLIMSM